MFRREAATAVFSQQKLDGFAFDVEILFVAKRLLLAVCEIPVNWVAQPGSKVNLLANSLRMLWDICHVRWVHLDLGQSPGDLLSDNNHVPHYTISRTEA
jgi:dolichyl-phosphate beta-glucosyltransferase